MIIIPDVIDSLSVVELIAVLAIYSDQKLAMFAFEDDLKVLMMMERHWSIDFLRAPATVHFRVSYDSMHMQPGVEVEGDAVMSGKVDLKTIYRLA